MRNTMAGRFGLALTGFAVSAAAATIAAPFPSADASANGIAVTGTGNGGDYHYTGQTYMMTMVGNGDGATCAGTLVDAAGVTHDITMMTETRGTDANQGTVYFAWTPKDVGDYTFTCTANGNTFGPVDIKVTPPPPPTALAVLLNVLGSSGGQTSTVKDGQVQGQQQGGTGSSGMSGDTGSSSGSVGPMLLGLSGL